MNKFPTQASDLYNIDIEFWSLEEFVFLMDLATEFGFTWSTPPYKPHEVMTPFNVNAKLHNYGFGHVRFYQDGSIRWGEGHYDYD